MYDDADDDDDDDSTIKLWSFSRNLIFLYLCDVEVVHE